MVHIPVLQKEVLKYLDPKPNQDFIDSTFGEGGHALAILEKIEPNGKTLGIDQDSEIIKRFKERIKNLDRLILISDNFVNLEEIVKKQNFKLVQGILFDLGMSSWHLAESGRGFSFLKKEPLDMRYNPQSPLAAEKIINYWSGAEIEKILREYGEEKFAKQISRKIIEIRKIKPIKTTFQLVEIIKKAIPHRDQHHKTHFATRAFQSLRIAVNDELNNLEKTLPQALTILAKGGRLVTISFHSLEDRIIKNFLKNQAKEGLLRILTKKPISPSKIEIKINPRSRSAKLRAALKL